MRKIQSSSAKRRRWVRRGLIFATLVAVVSTVYFVFFFDSRLITRFKGHDNIIHSVTYSPSGNLVAGGGHHFVRVWETESRSILHTWDHEDVVTSVAFSHDGAYIISGSRDSSVRIHQLDNGSEVQRLEAKYITNVGSRGQSPIVCISLAKEQTVLAAVSGEVFPVIGSSRVWVWDFVTGKEYPGFDGHLGDVNAVALSSDGNYGFSGGEDEIARFWDVATGRELREFKGSQGPIGRVAIDPKGQLAATSIASNLNLRDDYGVRIWEIETGKQVGILEGHTDDVLALAFSPDGTMILTGSRDNTVRLWDTESRSQTASFRNLADATSVAFSADGHRFVSAAGTSIKLWNVPD